MAGAMHIRNVWSDAEGSNNDGGSTVLFLLREMFRISDWVEDYLDADPAWSGNVILSLADVAVSAVTATQVTSATGGFTSSHIGKVLVLEGNDSNRGMYNIRNVLDTNTLLIDERCRTASWTTESGITARIVDPSDNVITNSKHTVWREPTIGLQVDFWAVDDDIYLQMYPKGDYLTTPNPCAVTSLSVQYSSSPSRFNAYLSDPTASYFFCYFSFYHYGQWGSACWGELGDVAVGDNYPGFTQVLCETGDWSIAPKYALRMLNDVDSQMNAYSYFYKRALGYAFADWRDRELLAQKINGGRAKRYRPQVLLLDTVSGQYMRGVHPMEFVHIGWPNDEFGSGYWKMGDCVIVPRNGSEDIIPFASSAW